MNEQKYHTENKGSYQKLDLSQMPWLDRLTSRSEAGKSMDQYGGVKIPDSPSISWIDLLTNIEEKGKDINQYSDVLKLRKDSILTPYGCKKLGLVSIDPVGKSGYVKKSA